MRRLQLPSRRYPSFVAMNGISAKLVPCTLQRRGQPQCMEASQLQTLKPASRLQHAARSGCTPDCGNRDDGSRFPQQ